VLDTIGRLIIFVLFPTAVTIVGGLLAIVRPPGPKLTSAVQHFAAGVVAAAVAGELLPEIAAEHKPVALIIGFALGLGVMLGVKELSRRMGRTRISEAATPSSLVATVAIDISLDGLLIGVGFAAGQKVGLLLTFALALELLFLGLSVSSALGKAGTARGRIIAIITGIAFLPLISALLGAAIFSQLAGFGLAVVLAFGAAALLYLAVEELLVEAHEEPETPLLNGAFFLGFVALYIVETSALSTCACWPHLVRKGD
jgi:zinc transporter, ZIP family